MLLSSSSSSIEKVSATAIVFVVIVEGMHVAWVAEEEVPAGGGGILTIVGAAETKVDGPPVTALVGFDVSMIL